MNQLTVEVSAPLLELITKLVLAVRVPTESIPCVPPTTAQVRKILEFAVTLVLLTVTVPPTRVACPMRALEPSLIFIPRPAVSRIRSQLDPVIDPFIHKVLKRFPVSPRSMLVLPLKGLIDWPETSMFRLPELPNSMQSTPPFLMPHVLGEVIYGSFAPYPV